MSSEDDNRSHCLCEILLSSVGTSASGGSSLLIPVAVFALPGILYDSKIVGDTVEASLIEPHGQSDNRAPEDKPNGQTDPEHHGAECKIQHLQRDDKYDEHQDNRGDVGAGDQAAEQRSDEAVVYGRDETLLQRYLDREHLLVDGPVC